MKHGHEKQDNGNKVTTPKLEGNAKAEKETTLV